MDNSERNLIFNSVSIQLIERQMYYGARHCWNMKMRFDFYYGRNGEIAENFINLIS